MPGVGVLVADDHPLYRYGLTRAICEDPLLTLIAECSSGREALEAAVALRPDVAVLDLRMPGLDGRRLTASIAKAGLPTRALMLSAFADADVVYEALAAGARGYICKESSIEEIRAAILAVAHGDTVLDPRVHAGLSAQIRARGTDLPSLSPRELEGLELVAKGRTADQIATSLIVGAATVRTHLQHLYDKLGVCDRASAVAEGMRRGILM